MPVPLLILMTPYMWTGLALWYHLRSLFNHGHMCLMFLCCQTLKCSMDPMSLVWVDQTCMAFHHPGSVLLCILCHYLHPAGNGWGCRYIWIVCSTEATVVKSSLLLNELVAHVISGHFMKEGSTALFIILL